MDEITWWTPPDDRSPGAARLSRRDAGHHQEHHAACLPHRGDHALLAARPPPPVRKRPDRGVPVTNLAAQLGHTRTSVTLDTFSHVLVGLTPRLRGCSNRLLVEHRRMSVSCPLQRALRRLIQHRVHLVLCGDVLVCLRRSRRTHPIRNRSTEQREHRLPPISLKRPNQAMEPSGFEPLTSWTRPSRSLMLP
jgi:hypothetical protein